MSLRSAASKRAHASATQKASSQRPQATNGSKRLRGTKASSLIKAEEPAAEAEMKQPRKRPSKREHPSHVETTPIKKDPIKLINEEGPALKKQKLNKKNPYGLSPGVSPYPNYPRPTKEECQEVARLLEAEHGKVQAPKTIPAPSLSTSGCGEVPSVLDALVRTRLSAATNNANSSRAFRGLVERFGLMSSGVGQGSVNWDAVRTAPVKEVFEAIKSGGLADVKSRDIQQILQMVYEENQQRKDALHAADAHNDDTKGPTGIKRESDEEKAAEITKAESNVLSLDHLHYMSSEDAFEKLLGYPGIGPKTASCVLLFCLQRPSFAVDTHVFRLAKLLKWVPLKENPTRNSTYAHCDARVPDELKYSLHYLLIKHGKNCLKCSARLSSDKSIKCPLDKLVDRAAARRYRNGE